MRVAVIVAVLGMGCGGGRQQPVEPPSNKPAVEPAPRPADRPVLVARGKPLRPGDLDETLRRTMTMISDLAQAADGAGANCAKLAGGMDSVISANGDLFAAARHWKSDPAAMAQADDWMRDHQAELMESVTKLSSAIQPCVNDPQVMAVMERLSKLGE